MSNNQNAPSKEEESLNLEHYLMQQGFFKDEVDLPSGDSDQMGDLITCARNYIRDKKKNHGHSPLIYLEAISYCILHRPYNELEAPQQKALMNFAELVAERIKI